MKELLPQFSFIHQIFLDFFLLHDFEKFIFWEENIKTLFFFFRVPRLQLIACNSTVCELLQTNLSHIHTYTAFEWSEHVNYNHHNTCKTFFVYNNRNKKPSHYDVIWWLLRDMLMTPAGSTMVPACVKPFAIIEDIVRRQMFSVASN